MGTTIMSQKTKFRWGFQWGKVGAGLVMLLVGGGISLALWQVGYINFWAAGTAVVGVFTTLSGLIGEEGVW
jgi:hypothetical protein